VKGRDEDEVYFGICGKLPCGLIRVEVDRDGLIDQTLVRFGLILVVE